MSDADQPVHRFPWNSPGSFLKSHLPLSKNQKLMMKEGTSNAEFSYSYRTHMCFTAPSLSICKARRHPPIKNGLNQGLSSEPGGR